MNLLLGLFFIISLGFGANYFQSELYSLSQNSNIPIPFNIPDTLKLVGIMVQFPIEDPDNPKTSGNGQFLSREVEDYINFYNSEISRCEGFLVDRPPHNSPYFKKQLEAVGNYYKNISNGSIPFDAKIIMNTDSESNGYYQVSKEMEYYAQGDFLLAELFSETLDSAKTEIETYLGNATAEDVVFVVFHAGLSQDFSYPSLDPTIYDLKSGYIDEEMMQGVTPAVISDYSINTGILLPETQNIIYYDVVEDIFGNPDYGTEDLCDLQVGMTGIFAMLLGYELGLPPMFNNDSSSIDYGDPGIGYFGLMDYGSNNGRGVMPVSPTPWTRIKADWSREFNINSLINPDTSLRIDDTTIYRFDIAEDEYFLIENRNNWVIPSVDIDSLRRKYKIDENQLGHWFDTVVEVFTDSIIQIDDETGVITGFDHYDYGLPGSGILIWHIKEPNENLYSIGVNNDRYNRHVQIEEADGSQDIGFESFAFFAADDPTIGTRWDMWFYDNEAYLDYGNPSAGEVVFSNTSNPSTRTTDDAETFLSITILPGDTVYTDDGDTIFVAISDIMRINVKFNDSISDEIIEIVNLPNEPNQYLGNSAYDSTGSVFYEKEEVIYRYYSDSTIIQNFNYSEEKVIYTYDNQIKYFAVDTCIHPLCNNFEYEIIAHGYIDSHIDSIAVPEALSLGDIDQDRLDEIITIEAGNIVAKNSNGTLVNGFPVKGNFSGVPLIANILPDKCGKEENKPEIICREGEDIVILSNCGERIQEFSSFDSDQPLALVPYWDGKMALVDGPRLFLFKLDLDHSYWLNPQSRPSGFPISTGTHIKPQSNSNLDWQEAYNYPNPITEGHTTFRFFVDNNVGRVQVQIYDASGFLVKDDLELNNPIENEFNEIKWDDIRVDSGLYLAEIKRNIGKSELVRLVVVR